MYKVQYSATSDITDQKKVVLIYSVAIFQQKRKGLFTVKGAYNKNDNTDLFISLMFVVFHNQCCMCDPFFVIAQDVTDTARPRNSFVQPVYDKYTLTLVLA